MADNILVTPGSGACVAADDIGGVLFQRVKATFGTDGVATDVSAANPLPVTMTVSSGGLTNTELRATPVPVSGTVTANVSGTVPVSGTFWQATQPISGNVGVTGSVAVTGTFWQATQPVSGTITANAGTGTFAVSAASLPLPSGAATETTLAAISTKTPALGQATMANSSPVVLASNQSAVPVSGTFYQATQPVSIASMPSTPVTGTFWQTTQPVSGTVTANAGTGTFAVSGTFWQATQPVSGTFWQATQPVSGTVTVTQATLTKGTQGATGVSTQDLKDAGRAIVNAATAIAGVTAVTTEALLALNVSRDGAATSSVTTIAVTSGKRLRITHMVVGFISTAAAVLSGRFSLRMNPSGAAAANSVIMATLPIPSGAALAQAGGSLCITIPDGIEFSGTQQIGISQVCSAITGTIWASLIGFEY